MERRNAEPERNRRRSMPAGLTNETPCRPWGFSEPASCWCWNGKSCRSTRDWYEQWRKAWDAITDAVDDTPQEAALFDELERLSILLCNTPARTPEGLLAQVSWIEADLGTYITEPVSEQHSDVFKVLKAGLAFLSA